MGADSDGLPPPLKMIQAEGTDDGYESHFQGAHVPPEGFLLCVQWCVSYAWSYRHVEKHMQERGSFVDHSTVSRWVIKYSLQLAGSSSM